VQPGCTIEVLSIPAGQLRQLDSLRPANILQFLFFWPAAGCFRGLTSSSLQAGDWYVDRNAGWAEPFIDQLLMFPNARHDDQVDMMTQAAVWLSENRRRVPIWRVTNAFTGETIYEA
jgi:hypothetical protein